jgi:predicted class III extradiol MEMO1 family dioxygenase
MVVHVAIMGEQMNTSRLMVTKSEVETPLGRLDIDGRIILKSIILEK